MGRSSRSAITTTEAMRLEISIFTKRGYFKTDSCFSSSFSWTNGSSISYDLFFMDERQEIRLHYWNQNNSGERNDMDYIIQLTSVPSNLGKGEVWYFVCPQTGRKTKILYKAYGSLHFKSREAYQNRIYYPSQISSKLNYNCDRFWELKRRLEKLNPLCRKNHYQGKETRLMGRIRSLEAQKEYHDSLMWSIMPKSLIKKMDFDFKLK